MLAPFIGVIVTFEDKVYFFCKEEVEKLSADLAVFPSRAYTQLMDSNDYPIVRTLVTVLRSGTLYSILEPIPMVHDAIGMVICVVEVTLFVVPAVEEVVALPLLRAVTIGELQNSRLFLFPSIAPASNVVDLWAYHNEPGDRSVGWIVEVVLPAVIAPLGLAARVRCQTVRTSVGRTM